MSERLRRIFERYEKELITDEYEGLVTAEEARQLHQDLTDEYRNAAEDAAEEAKEREQEQWWSR